MKRKEEEWGGGYLRPDIKESVRMSAPATAPEVDSDCLRHDRKAMRMDKAAATRGRTTPNPPLLLSIVADSSLLAELAWKGIC